MLPSLDKGLVINHFSQLQARGRSAGKLYWFKPKKHWYSGLCFVAPRVECLPSDTAVAVKCLNALRKKNSVHPTVWE